MEDEIICAEGEGAFDFATECGDALFADRFRLAAYVDEVAGVNDQRRKLVFGAEGVHALALRGIDFGGAPHARAGGEDLESVGADLAGALSGFGGAACGAQVDADALDQGDSLAGQGWRTV